MVKNIKKKLLLQNHKAQSFHILYVAMFSAPLYKSCQSCPWGQKWPRPGGHLLPYTYNGKNIKKNLLLRNHKAQSFHILSVAMYRGPLYKSCQPCPWGPYGPCLGGVMRKTLKNLLRNHKTQSFYILCVAMYSSPFYKSCQPGPGVHTGPAGGGGGGGVMGKTKKNLLLRNYKAQSFPILFVAIQALPRGHHGKNFKKSSSSKPQGPKLSYFVCSNV